MQQDEPADVIAPMDAPIPQAARSPAAKSFGGGSGSLAAFALSISILSTS
jgi:hypothetical protein